MAEIIAKVKLELEVSEDWQEKSRQYAESKMPENWNRKDTIEVGTFYGWYIKFIVHNYALIPME